MKESMRMSLYVPPEIYNALREQADKQGIAVKTLITRLLATHTKTN